MTDDNKNQVQVSGPHRQELASVSVTPGQMLMAAIEQGVDFEKLETLMALQERWEAKESRKAFDTAIAMARAEIKPIVKNSEVNFRSAKGHTQYRHETLDGIASQIDPILGRFGLSYRFRSKQEGQCLHVTCVVAHKDGHSEETTLFGPPDQSGNKNSYQAVGSAATYLQRYTLKLALGLSAAKDDDAGAVNQQQEHRQPRAKEAITEQRLTTAIERIKNGEFTTAKLHALFDLTEEQAKRVADEFKEVEQQ